MNMQKGWTEVNCLPVDDSGNLYWLFFANEDIFGV
jgi:hypothetical protein